MSDAITVEGVSVAYDDMTAIADVDLAVDAGEFVTVIGPSGCGKTTLLRTIGGLEEPTTGTVRVGGEAPSAAQQQGRLGFVFQQHSLLPWKSVLENVTFLRTLAGKPADTDEARALLGRFGLDGYAEAYPKALSGGMAQRVAIARALHLGADVLLMDEPFGELDELTRERMGVEVSSVWRRQAKTVLFVTHSVPEAVLLGDRCVVVRGTPGRVTETFDIDLPRPRDQTTLETTAFQDAVAPVRAALRAEDG